MQRDPHLPPPEVCDWLLAQEWSGAIPTAITTFPLGGPGGISGHTAYDHVYARAALGADEVFAIELPVEALAVLRADAEARREAINLKRQQCEAEELERKADREANRVDESLAQAQSEILAALNNIISTERTDPETDLLRRILADAEQADLSAMSVIGVLTTAATMMVSQCYDLTLREPGP
jgi:hypothetical protein